MFQRAQEDNPQRLLSARAWNYGSRYSRHDILLRKAQKNQTSNSIQLDDDNNKELPSIPTLVPPPPLPR